MPVPFSTRVAERHLMTSFDCESSVAQDNGTVFVLIRRPGRNIMDKKKENFVQDLWQHGSHSHPESHRIRIWSARISNLTPSPIAGEQPNTVILMKMNAVCSCKNYFGVHLQFI